MHASNRLSQQKQDCQICVCVSSVPVNPTRSILSLCQHVWALPVEMCSAGGCMKNSSESAELVFTLHSSTAVTLEEDEVIFFIAQLVLMKLCLALSLATAALLTCSSPSSPPPPIPLGAEVIQKECLALVQQMIERERETEKRKESNIEIKGGFFGVMEDFLFCFSLKTTKHFWERGPCCCGPFSGAHLRNPKNTCGCMFSKIFGFCLLWSSKCQKGFWRPSWE